jgi:ribosomal protein RSM22 (predicted rRNA methylase)
MNCTKNMIRVAVGIGTVLVAAYMMFPEFRSAIVGLAPFAVALICPISMLFMMKMMTSSKPDKAKENAVVPVPVESAGSVTSRPASREEATS